IEFRQLVRVEDFLLLAMLGEERHLLDPGLELDGTPVQIDRALRDGVILDPLGAHQLVHHALAVLAEPELDERVAAGSARRALAQELQAPRVQAWVGTELDADRGLLALERLPQHLRRARRGPRKRVSRRDDARVSGRGLETDALLFLQQGDL